MALRTLKFLIRADGSQYQSTARRAKQATDDIGESVSGVTDRLGRLGSSGAVAAGAIIAGFTQAIQLAEELGERMHELDRQSTQTGIDATLLGEGRAAALAVQAVGQQFGIGAEQYFDASEAVLDALRRDAERPEDAERAATQAAQSIGLDIDAFSRPDISAFERSNMLLDTLLAFEGDQYDLLTAASELGAGDIRDFVSLAGVVRADQRLHPRSVAHLLDQRGAVISDAEAHANAVNFAQRSVEEIVGREMQSRQGAFGVENILSTLTPFDDYVTRRLGRETLGYSHFYDNFLSFGGGGYSHFYDNFLSFGGEGEPIFTGRRSQDVTVVIEDSTAGGVKASQRVTDAQSDGRTVTADTDRLPSR